MLSDLLKILLPAAAGVAVVAGLAAVTVKVVNERTLRRKAKEKYENAFKLLIMEKKRNAVKVGIFDKEQCKLGELEVRSDEEVNDSISVNQVIYC